jgi:aquaporin rerated protein, other eukaryote
VGTTLFLWFSFAGAQASAITGGSTAGTPNEVVLTSLAFGFSLLVTVWAFYRISGGLFNPAVRYNARLQPGTDILTLPTR